MNGHVTASAGGGSPLVYAHRGASLELPENTLEAFARGLEAGAGALETDAHMTRDGRIVLSHDATGLRMAGVARAIRDATLNEVRGWDVAARFEGALEPRRAYRMPTLDEALAALPDAFFNIDAKQTSPEMVPSLLRAIRAARAERRVRIASFSSRNLRRARELGYEGAIGLSASELARAMLSPTRRLAGALHGDAAQVPVRAYGVTFASQRAIDRLHGFGVRVDFWTIDDPEQAKKLVAMGADGIVTNDPRAIAAALGVRRDR